jgi:hypothetical protein
LKLLLDVNSAFLVHVKGIDTDSLTEEQQQQEQEEKEEEEEEETVPVPVLCQHMTLEMRLICLLRILKKSDISSSYCNNMVGIKATNKMYFSRVSNL